MCLLRITEMPARLQKPVWYGTLSAQSLPTEVSHCSRSSEGVSFQGYVLLLRAVPTVRGGRRQLNQ